ncbi:hypothetical protein EGT74_20250 [Chitinophaga lutea]|uniref:Uncharacterized protein n=2 Tax=Chitinophaga lutea TaxID=2488634 RepID=A0A3N4QE04_9BACT|nr:hypothetical protein EGT74_20250 [Chitinophaga lutea]
MTFLYTARGIYDPTCDSEGLAWREYVEWSKLTHLTELVSVDYSLNEILVEPDRDNAEDWEFVFTVNYRETSFFRSSEYVFRRMKARTRFNLLAIVIEPGRECRDIPLDGYEFMGYDLLDQYFETSALSNCGGFEETFSRADLNAKGLIADFTSAKDIQKRLFENNPGEDHADTNIIAIWRHATIGR